MKNILINCLLALIPKQRKSSSQAHILIVSTTGLGDTLWGTPSIRALKAMYPNKKLSILTSPIGADIYSNNPYIDHCFILKKNTFYAFYNLFLQLKKYTFETVYILHISQRFIVPMLSRLNTKTMIGFQNAHKGFDHLLTAVKSQSSCIHHIQRRLNLINAPKASSHMDIFLTDYEYKAAKNYLSNTQYTIIFHPGSKDRFKQWPPQRFISLGKRIASSINGVCLITGDHQEQALAQYIANNIPNARSLAGSISLRITAALIAQCSALITNDTGPMHLAFTLQTPTISLFAPTDSSQCGPYHLPSLSRSQVIQKPRTCEPCLYKKCQEPFCMDQISPREVFSSLSSLLKESSDA